MVKLSFIGDIGLNDDYVRLKQNDINPFHALEPHLSSSDFVIGNLECTVKGDMGENLLKKPRISTDLQTLSYLKNINLRLATLATNHVYDNLTDGFQKTVSFLQSQHISGIGAGINCQNAERYYSVTIRDISFCFFNYITVDTNPSMPKDSGVFINVFDESKCISDLKMAANYDYRIVLMHWGGKFEGGLYPDFSQISLGRRLIDNGADLIIGHHTHTLQPFDVYKGKYIFYSLGNFCFSDIRFEDKIRKMSALRERESVVLHAEFDKSGYHIRWIPFRNELLFLVPRKIVGIKYTCRNACWTILKNKPFWLAYQWWFNYARPVIVQLKRKDENRSLLSRILLQVARKVRIKTGD